MDLQRVRIPISRLFLDLDNPRFEPVQDEPTAIAHLAKDEKVAALAEDIIKQNGMNPMDIVGVYQVQEKGNSAKYKVLEGNRRICAIKLLNDPDLAPPDLRKRFQKLAEKWSAIKDVEVVVFPSRDDAKPWLERLHEGEKDGVGRKAWNPTQKQRFTGNAKNAQAVALFELALQEGWVTKDETQGLLTTVQRFLNNPVFRDLLGITGKDPEELRRTRPQEDFHALVKQFISDAVTSKSAPKHERTVHSRTNANDIQNYGHGLIAKTKVSNDRIDPELVNGSPSAGGEKKSRRTRPKPPQGPKKLDCDTHNYKALKALGNHKLTALYYSSCELDLEHHSVLISVGVWSFFECLTAAAGRKEGITLAGFLGRDFLQNQCGLGKEDAKAVVKAVENIVQRGNDSKHHPFAGSYDAKQINNDWVATQSVIKGLIQKIADAK